MTTRAPSNRLSGIQMGRGAAALLVVLYHTGRSMALPQYAGAIPFHGMFNFGHAGVDFFFVLSGFVIHYVHHGDIGAPAALWRYLRRRLTRIYPIYWVVTALVVLLAVLRPGGAALPEPWHLLTSVLLLPEQVEPVLGVAWTLVHEMMFYALFALAIISRRLGAVLLAVWVALILAGGVAAATAPASAFSTLLAGNASLRVLTAPINLEFLLGIAVAHVTLRYRLPRPLLLTVLATLAFAAAGLAEDAGLLTMAGQMSDLLFGVSSVVIVAGLAAAERQGKLRISPAAVFLGDASYSLYLIHTVVIGLTVRVMATLGIVRLLPLGVVFALAALTALVSGIVLHVLIERRLLRWLAPARRAGR